MIFSKEQIFSDREAISGTVAASDNVIDLGETGTVLNGPAPLVRDIGPGQPVSISVSGVAAVAADVLTVVLETDSAEAFDADPLKLLDEAIVTADGVPFETAWNWLPDGSEKRYLRLTYAFASTGTAVVTAGIVLAKQTNKTVAGA